jgi:hypothetical protein
MLRVTPEGTMGEEESVLELAAHQAAELLCEARLALRVAEQAQFRSREAVDLAARTYLDAMSCLEQFKASRASILPHESDELTVDRLLERAGP